MLWGSQKNIGIGSWKVKPCGGSRENRPNCALEVREFLGNALGVCPCCGIPKKAPGLCLGSERVPKTSSWIVLMLRNSYNSPKTVPWK